MTQADDSAGGQGGVVSTQKELAERLGVAADTVGRWRRAGMPVRADGQFDVDTIDAWREEARRPGRPPDRDAKRLRRESLEWHTKYRQERALVEKLRRREMEGDLIQRSIVEEILAGRAAMYAKRVLGLGRTLALELVGMDAMMIQTRIEDECRDLLAELARTGRIPDAIEPAESPSTDEDKR